MGNTSRNMEANKHYVSKKITKRCPKTRNILSTDELLYWFSKYSYQFDCKKFTVVGERSGKATKHTETTLEGLAVYLKKSVALKRDSQAGKKGELPINLILALYHSNRASDPKKDVELVLFGAEGFASNPEKRKKRLQKKKKAAPKKAAVKLNTPSGLGTMKKAAVKKKKAAVKKKKAAPKKAAVKKKKTKVKKKK